MAFLSLIPARRRAGLLAGALIGSFVASVWAPAAQGATAGAQVGVVADLSWGISRADMDRSITLMREGGVSWARVNASWVNGEPATKGVLHQGFMGDLDYAVTQARAAGIQVIMPIADGVPYWASADPAKYTDAAGPHWNKRWKPTNPSDYADFVRTVVNRYKVLGVHTYEVWNEPNLAWFWPSGPSAADYTRLLAAAAPAIRQADPAATVVLGGLSKGDYVYLEQLYQAGAGPFFDAVAIHPYSGSVDPTACWNQAGTTKYALDAFCSIEEVRRTMVAYGDSAKNIWLTEFGWTTTTGSYGVSEATQASYFTKAMTKLQSYPYVKVAIWYNFRNTYWLRDDPASWEANCGMIRTDFTAKPVYNALKAWTGGATTATTTAPTTPTTVAPTTTTVAAPTTTVPAPTTTTVAPRDTTAPVISSVRAQASSTSASFTWVTNEASSTQVTYWSGSRASITASGPGGVTSHVVSQTGLAPNSKYSYTVRSVDAAGNVSTSATYSLRTP